MNGMQAADRARCEELALAPGRPFDIALRFTHSAAADRLLALEALFRVLRELPWAVSDPTPGLAQLAWWHEEISQAAQRGSQHPVVRALRDCGALEALQGASWNTYLRVLGEQLVDNAISNQRALAERLQATAGLEVAIMARSDTAPAAGADKATAAVHLLDKLSRIDLSLPAPAWVPLDLVARFGTDRTQPAALVAGLAGLGIEWQWQAPVPAAPNNDGLRLLALQAWVAAQLLERLHAKPERALARGANRASPRDVLGAWRLARRWKNAEKSV
jgi:hypothetical protein